MEEKILKQINLIKDTWNNFKNNIEFTGEIDKNFLYSMKKTINKIDSLMVVLIKLIFEKNDDISNELNNNFSLEKDIKLKEKNKMKTITEEVKELKTPVIFRIKPLYKFSKNREERIKRVEYYYSGRAQRDGKTKNRTYLDYITRNNANRKIELSREEILELNKLRKTNIKEYNKKIEYYSKIKSQNLGLWSKEGIVAENRLKEIKENLLKVDGKKQFVWDSVISFSEPFCEKYNVYNPETIYNTLKDRINMLFWSKRIDPDSMEWFFSFHSNTDNPHVHILFFEKEPTRIGERYESEYVTMGSILKLRR
ncbi:relaxase MobL [Spiroplasma cantharicola]|uniref:Uncharacterized protein n=1 Tax=Spiroplasma cantharicola TaxID=362837 RepID=A0A0M3SJA1_9MOLU|nr:relaxase MobL [Spiroplasma cantharicola]ALD66374.1 hypothetical protein SCANT_v1c04680 [Spiroplasma cantharicola]